MNSDPTWESITNWYWRSWEVCIGVTAACIPALRPGYKTVVAGIASYRSHRSSRKTSDTAFNSTQDKSKVFEGQGYSAYSAAVQAISSEADRAQAFGAGEEGFEMKRLPGDAMTAEMGIKKTTEIDISGLSAQSADGSYGNLSLREVDEGLRNTDFF